MIQNTQPPEVASFFAVSYRHMLAGLRHLPSGRQYPKPGETTKNGDTAKRRFRRPKRNTKVSKRSARVSVFLERFATALAMSPSALDDAKVIVKAYCARTCKMRRPQTLAAGAVTVTLLRAQQGQVWSVKAVAHKCDVSVYSVRTVTKEMQELL
jgi:transcription initiation factor TFIIIB Brf1 subunit/transcription initiation factor TFIIB